MYTASDKNESGLNRFLSLGQDVLRAGQVVSYVSILSKVTVNEALANKFYKAMQNSEYKQTRLSENLISNKRTYDIMYRISRSSGGMEIGYWNTDYGKVLNIGTNKNLPVPGWATKLYAHVHPSGNLILSRDYGMLILQEFDQSSTVLIDLWGYCKTVNIQ